MILVTNALIAGSIISFIVYKILCPEIKLIREIDKELEKQNNELDKRYRELSQLCSDLEDQSD